MIVDAIYLLYAVIIAGTLLIVEGVFYFIYDGKYGPKKRINRRLAMQSSSGNRAEALKKLLRTPKNKTSLSDLAAYRYFDEMITRAGWTISTGRLFRLMGLAWLGIYLSIIAFVPWAHLIGVVMGFVLGMAFPLLVLVSMKNKRAKKFTSQLPEAIDVLVRGLKAGHPISAAMKLVASDLSDPIATEFGIVIDEMTYGLDLETAFDGMRKRVESEELDFLIIAINIQNDTGGNLAEVLTNLSKVLRDRFRMKRRVSAISSEARISAYILSALPIFVFIGMNILNPGYFAPYFGDRTFQLLMLGGVGLMVLGIIIMFRMINFRI